MGALAGDGKWADDIDASPFVDADGTVYVVWGGGWIARTTDDMSGMAEAPRMPLLISPDTLPAHHARSNHGRCGASDIGHEGAYLFRRGYLYYLTAADQHEGRYSSMVAVADNVYGPSRLRHEAVPCSGGAGYFRDHQGNWECIFFGNDAQAPFREMPAMIRADFTADGHIIPAQ